jgi:radical SAM family uncharacterized protein/radical SAM-linked protein
MAKPALLGYPPALSRFDSGGEDPMWPDRAAYLDALDRLLPEIEKPTRYIGGEWNSFVKDADSVDCRVVLAFPDTYEIGMSHLGFRILYSRLNQLEGVAAERVFMPWYDMLTALRARNLPLTTLETRRVLSECDIVGFSMQYELTITNLLAMLEQSGIPLLAAERREHDPLVLAGGPVVFNAEPFADFCDLILVGDGEEAFPEMIELYRRLKREGATRLDLVRQIAQLDGWYAPQLYRLEQEPVCGFWIPRPAAGENVPAKVKRRVVYNLNQYPFPEQIVVAHSEIVHDRVSWEIMRGCPVGCRFCQAGYIYRPTRERDPQAIKTGVLGSLQATGYDEFSLTSLNTGEYGAIVPLLTDLMDEAEPRKIAVGLSSLHATTMTESLVEQVKRVRKAGFTIAPEAGSQRMRNVINKNLTEEDILRATRLAYQAGWQSMKLYFMIGQPTEQLADVDGIVQLTSKILQLGRSFGGSKVRVTLSASTFVPKPFTPFQWFGMDSEALFRTKQERIRSTVPRGVEFRHHNHGESWLEGVLSRADRSVGRAILEAYRRGAVLDSWGEHFKQEIWREAFAATGIDAEKLATQQIPLEAELPWEVIDPLIRRKWLEVEYHKALEAATMSTCVDACSGCAPFSNSCVKGTVHDNKWLDFGVKNLQPLPAFNVKTAPKGRGEDDSAKPPGPLEGAASVSAEPAAIAPPPAGQPPVYRYRARFEKLGRSRFLGHLDLMRALTMALRRAGVQVLYSGGYKPRPRVSLSHALALGIASHGEYLDFEMAAPIDPDLFVIEVNAKLQEGIRFTAVVPIALATPALQEAITVGHYRAQLEGLAKAELERAVAEFLARSSVEVVRVKKGKEKRIDLRRTVSDLRVEPDGTLFFGLIFDLAGSPKHGELLEAVLGAARAASAQIERVDQYVRVADRLVSPLIAGRVPRRLSA